MVGIDRIVGVVRFSLTIEDSESFSVVSSRADLVQEECGLSLRALRDL